MQRVEETGGPFPSATSCLLLMFLVKRGWCHGEIISLFTTRNISLSLSVILPLCPFGSKVKREMIKMQMAGYLEWLSSRMVMIQAMTMMDRLQAALQLCLFVCLPSFEKCLRDKCRKRTAQDESHCGMDSTKIW